VFTRNRLSSHDFTKYRLYSCGRRSAREGSKPNCTHNTTWGNGTANTELYDRRRTKLCGQDSPNNGREQTARTSISNVYKQEEGTLKDHELMEKRKL